MDVAEDSSCCSSSSVIKKASPPLSGGSGSIPLWVLPSSSTTGSASAAAGTSSSTTILNMNNNNFSGTTTTTTTTSNSGSPSSVRSTLMYQQDWNDATSFRGDGNALIFTAKQRKNPLYILVIGFAMLGIFLYSKSHSTLHAALQQVTILTHQRQRIHSQLRLAEKDVRRLQAELLAMDQQLNVEKTPSDKEDASSSSSSSSANKDNAAVTSKDGLDGGKGGGSKADVVDEMVALQDKLRRGNRRIGSLQRHVQDISRRDAIEKYGAGVHRIELELEFPDSPDGPNTLVIEMAPLELMPHSVFTFMEMVDAKLFDGCSFILNAMHVIKAAPLPYDGSSASAKVRSFTKRGLESVAFREYSPDYPHEQYTVGFAADGSPSFYFNTQDNTDIHVGDPCFGKIISGIDTVQRLEASPTRNGIWYRQRIGLKRATILQ